MLNDCSMRGNKVLCRGAAARTYLTRKKTEKGVAPMLVLSRRVDESILIGEDIEIFVTRIGTDHVRLGICASLSKRVWRSELVDAGLVKWPTAQGRAVRRQRRRGGRS